MVRKWFADKPKVNLIYKIRHKGSFDPIGFAGGFKAEEITHEDAAFVAFGQAAEVAFGHSDIGVAQQAADFLDGRAGFFQRTSYGAA